VSRAYNWLHLFNHPSPTSSARRFERWNREVGTRIGAAVASAADIGPQLLSAMQGGMLLVSEEGTPYSPAPSGRGDGGEQPGRGAMPQYEGDGFRNGAKPDAGPGNETEAGPAEPDAPAPAPTMPYGNSELFWDFVI
jgi:hypothetical protein